MSGKAIRLDDPSPVRLTGRISLADETSSPRSISKRQTKLKRKRSDGPEKRYPNSEQSSNNVTTAVINTKKTRKRKRKKSQCLPHQSYLAETLHKSNNQNINTAQSSVGKSFYPYPTDYNDHFETPLYAYTDIRPLMQIMMNKKIKDHNTKKSSSPQFTIYDPYFCTGRAKSLLEETFKECNAEILVQHQKRDFYKDICKHNIPPHDILVTNPPYSGNHKERCLEFAVDQLKSLGIPFFLLMPNYVASKQYFRKLVLEEKIQNIFVAPSSSRPYEYDHPEGTGHESSPFQSVWFCGFSQDISTKLIKDQFVQTHKSIYKSRESLIPRIATNLKELVYLGCVSGDKRKNPRQRKKMRRLAIQKANQSSCQK